MKNKTLWSLVICLIVLRGIDFFLTPESLASVVKQDLGATKTMDLAVAAYRKGGESAVVSACYYPIEAYGYFHQCAVSRITGTNDMGYFDAVTITVATYSDKETAWGAVFGRTVWDREKLRVKNDDHPGTILVIDATPIHTATREMARIAHEY